MQVHEILEKLWFYCRSRHKREGGSSSSGRNRARISLSLRIGAHRVGREETYTGRRAYDETRCRDVRAFRFAALSHLCVCFSFSVARLRWEIRALAKWKKAYRNKTSARSYISPLSQFHLVLCHSISIYFVMRLGAWLSRAPRIVVNNIICISIY